MRLPLLWLVIWFAVNVAADIYIYIAALSYCRRVFWSRLQLVTAIILYLVLVCLAALPLRSGSNSTLIFANWLLYGYFSVYLAKYIFVIFDLAARIPLLWHHKRWRWVTRTGGCVAILAFCALCWGTVNRYNIDVERVTVVNSTLPPAFEDFKIAQISDLHLGSYNGDTALVAEMVDSINSLKPDMIVFTGDLVNRRTAEALPFVSVLGRLKAPYGVFAVRGNHDYGDYENWPTPQARQRNNDDLTRIMHKMHWMPLDNDAAVIASGGDTLVVIGVENIGDPPFHSYGDLTKAYPTPEDSKYKILLTHNPAHWTDDIADNPSANVALSLSGHTHAMQIALCGISPARFRYRTWQGLFADARNQQLYVNRGFGTVGMPSRVGATPEITLLTLKK